ncbi:type I secretion system permease/ATPase [Sphingobium fluviale]|uniref:Type I secretion system permease/ATPase n=1 Tax=Sphingobium fluviale TaxID=2506423 RepID=A0A4Q1KJD5_9SPHN|nr:type I secretion system permease/ATPase [Sphingobium fluviale]RXR29941.1 type I secretion system permease/ATPase [Sphingobium fluviale]
MSVEGWVQGDAARQRLALVMAHARRAMIATTVLSAVLNVLLLSGSLYMMLVYDMVLPSNSIPTLVGLAVLVLVAYAFQGVLDFIRSRVLLHFSAAVDVDLSEDVHKLMSLMARTQTSMDSLQPMRDLDQLRQFLAGPGPSALVDLPWMLFFIIILFLLHPYLGITVLIGGAILVFLTFLTERLTAEKNQKLMQLAGNRQVVADITRRHAEVLSAMGMEGRIGERWRTTSGQFLAAQEKLNAIANSLSNLTKILRMVLQSGVLTVGALLVMNQQASGGVIFASSILASRALAPVEAAIANWRGFVSARQGWARLKSLILAMPEFPATDMLPAPEKLMVAEDVTLGPPGTERLTVQGVKFGLRAGEALAILGPSGCGKSTLVRGLAGIWPLVSGAVRLDNADIKQWPPESLGRHIGYLPQNVELIGGTVAENIARFDPDAQSEDVIKAAQLAGVHDLILHLPDGYNTSVGADGRALSGGQRQRIGLARALYGNPFLIILDEPNSNLDSLGEDALASAIADVRARGAIVIAVAHRPSLLASVDMVLLMKEGKAVAFGPRDKLVGHLLPDKRAEAPAPAPNVA